MGGESVSGPNVCTWLPEDIKTLASRGALAFQRAAGSRAEANGTIMRSFKCRCIQHRDLQENNEARPSFGKYVLEQQAFYHLSDDEAAYLAGTMFGAGSDTVNTRTRSELYLKNYADGISHKHSYYGNGMPPSSAEEGTISTR